jgi:hypothetical protein
MKGYRFLANTTAMVKYEEKMWLTLITCDDHKGLSQKYSYCRIVRAISAKPEE